MLNEHMPHMVMEGLNKVCFFSVCMHRGRGGVFEMVVKWLLNLVPGFQHWIAEIMDDEYVQITSN